MRVWNWEKGQEIKEQIGGDAMVVVDTQGFTTVIWTEVK